ncbi:MAG TPA: NAD(P)-binding protein [Opitutaceae bacterium]|jgi:flavin-dependent dehydrogenase|nr:NAD(P)-binding protein [Opitutaceae bacterium]
MTLPRPIEIIGGGLSGLALGAALRRADVPVVIFEAGAYPRHRVCGEFITGLDEKTISCLGLAPLFADATRHQSVLWYLHGAPMRVQTLPSPALGLSRHALDARLAGEFVRLGGELRTQTRVADDSAPPGRVFATGRRRGRPAWLGLKFHVRGLELAADLELHLGHGAYVGLTPVEDGLVNVCGLFHRRDDVHGDRAALLLAHLRAAGLDQLAGRIEPAKIDENSFSAVAGLRFDRSPPRTNRLVLGDAFAMIPPFTGNGMAMAFQSAELALGPLLAYARGDAGWPATCRAVHTRLQRRFRLRLASASALHAFLFSPRRQDCLFALNRAHLLPLRPLYHALH